MRQRAGILGELRRAQHPHVVDPLDRRRADVGREALVAEDGEAFLEAQLEPVAAGDAVARPIVEIFVGDDPGDGVDVGVGGGLGVGQHIARVEDVEALVLHRPEVEVVDGDDVELVEIIFAAIFALVPGHGLLEALHGESSARQIGLAHPDGEVDGAAAHRREVVAVRLQIAGDHGEQIARLGERVFPFGPMHAVRVFARGNAIAVGQQHRVARLVGAHPHPIARQHVRTVGMEGDPPEAFALALGAQDAARFVQPHQLAVGGGMDFGVDTDLVRLSREREQQGAILHRPLVGQFAVNPHAERLEAVTVQQQRRVAPT